MPIHELAQSTAKTGKLNAVWYDDETETFVVQYEFFQIAFTRLEFEAFFETLAHAKGRFDELKL